MTLELKGKQWKLLILIASFLLIFSHYFFFFQRLFSFLNYFVSRYNLIN